MPSYSAYTWVDDDGSLTVGTAFSAERMNAIEAGVAASILGIDHDASSQSPSFTATKSWTHTPVANDVRGVLVFIDANAATTDEITGVEYGGVQLTEVPGSPFTHSEGAEDSVIHVWFLGSGVPRGAQSVTVTCSSSANTKVAFCATITADTDLRVEGNAMSTTSKSSTESFELSREAKQRALLYSMLHSGNDAVGTVSVSGNEVMLQQFDFGSQTAHLAARYPAQSGSRTITWKQSAGVAGAVMLLIGRVRDFGVVTELPSLAGIGDRCTYKAATGVYWELVYTGEAEYPWAKIGGPPLIARSDTERTLTNKTAYESLPTDPLAITAPLKGDYDISIEGWVEERSATSGIAYLSYAVGATAASDNWAAVTFAAAGAAPAVAASLTTRQTAVAASASIAEKARTGGNYVCAWQKRRLRVDPVRVG